ncbi:MAG TPA: LysR family transcriptional regulator [Ramlibacter sp.]|nr:LysR family transcriptional regulator [Ramlibacter sp.]
MHLTHRLQNLDLRRLQHVVALADEGSFRRASEQVHLSQPAFSRSIQAAETELGLKLFDRGSVEARLTPAGAFFVQRARALLLQTDRLDKDMAMFRDREVGDVTFGTGPFPAAVLVPGAIAQLRARYPHVSVRVSLGNSQDLMNCVQRQEHEFFVANARRVPRNGPFKVRSLGRIRGGFYVRAGHPLLAHKSCSVADLLPFGVGAGKLPQDVSLHLAKSMGLPEGTTLTLSVECDDAQLLKRVALGSDTVIIATDDLLSSEIGRHEMAMLPVKDFPPDFSQSQVAVVSLAGRTPSPAAAYLMDAIVRLGNPMKAVG